MPKELFNQSPLGEGQEPADADRIALGQPGQAGAVNMTWAQVKAILGTDAERSSVKFDVNNPPVITQEGEMYWNGDYHTIAFDSGLGEVRIGQELYLLYYNDTGATITAGSILHLKSATDVGGGLLIPTPELADASKWELTQGTLSIACCDILDGELGLTLKDGIVEGVDTSGVNAGAQLWLSDDGSGQFTDVKPVFPSYSISLGGSFNSAVDGKVLVSITKDIYDTFGDAWDGAIRESFNFTVSSDGVNVTGLLENVTNSNDLTAIFSDGFYTLDTTTTPLTVALTAGTDSVPVTNYVYLLKSNKAVTVSISDWPTAEHSKIAQLEIGDPATVQSEGGCVRNQNINDHVKKEDDNGHILHITERMRQLNAQHDNGTEATFDNTGGNGYIVVTGGQVWQLHKQDFPAINMALGANIRIVNDFTTAFRRTSNLASITTYSDGTAWNNEWSKIVVWGVANKSGEPSFLMCNLPSNGYNSEANALADALNYADYSIPKEYKGVGFLIAAFVIRISGGVITYNTGYQDLRGFVPNNIAGGGAGGGGGVTTFLALTDTPSVYAGFAGYTVKVNQAGTGLEFVANEIKGTPILQWLSDGTATPPGTGQFKVDASNNLMISKTANSVHGQAYNIEGYIGSIASGSRIQVFDTINNDTLGVDVSGAPVDQGTYWSIPYANFETAGVTNLRYFTLDVIGGGGAAVTSVEKNPFTETIEIATLLQHSPTYTPTPNTTLNLVKGAASTFIGGTYQVVFICDNNTFNFSADFEENTSSIENVSGRVWLVFALNPDGNIGVAQYGATGGGLPQLVAPTLNTVDATSNTELTANWTDNNSSPNEASFTLQADTANTFDTVNLVEITGIAADSVSQLITGLLSSTLYYVRVMAIGDGSTVTDSAWSNVISQTTALAAPTVDTISVTDIINLTANINAEIISTGGAAITAHGAVWNTTGTPTLADSSTNEGAGSVGLFTTQATGLLDGQLYYVRAYATNSVGTTYGDELTFTAEDVLEIFLTFQPANLFQLTDNGDESYTGTNTSNWDSYGLADDTISPGQSYEVEIADRTTESSMIGLRADNQNTKWNATNDEWDYMLMNNQRYYHAVNGSLTDSGIPSQTGDLMRLRVVDDTTDHVVAEYFRSGSWNLIHDFGTGNPPPALLYAQMSTFNTGNKVTNPKKY